MSVKPFSEVEAEFDLSDPEFERKWHNKKTKLAKIFWKLVCHNSIHSILIEGYNLGDKGYKKYDLDVITEAYMHLFYRPLKIFNSIRGHCDGIKTAEIKEAIDFELTESSYFHKMRDAKGILQNTVEEMPFTVLHNNNTISLYPEIDIEGLDGRHPELSSVSGCFSQIDNSDTFVKDKHMDVLLFNLKSSHIKKLNEAADEIMLSRLFLDAILIIKQQTKRHRKIEMKIEVEGATDALEDALLYHPEFIHLSDKQKKYQLENRYCLKGGKKLSSIQTAIKRQREKENE